MAVTRSSAGQLLAISLVWGSTWIANGMLADAGPALHLLVLRYLLAALCVALFCGGRWLVHRVQRRAPGLPLDAPKAQISAILPRSVSPSARTHAWLVIGAVLGLSMFALPDLFLVSAARHGVAAWTPMIYAALPLGLLLVQGEFRPAAILGLSGMLLLLNGSLPVAASKLPCVLLIAAAVALQGWSLLYVRRHLAEASSLRCMLVQMLTAGLALEVAFRLWPGQVTALPLRSWPASSLAALGFLAGPATAVAYLLYYRQLRALAPAQLAVTAWVQTVIAVAESALLARLLPGWQMIASACLLLLCTLWMLREDPADQAGLSVRLS